MSPIRPLFAPRLKTGDHLRVIAPSRSLALISDENQAAAIARLADLGLTVSFGAHARECDLFGSSAIAARVADLHAAFADPAVSAILTVIGGFNSNQLLGHLDYGLIAKNPKILCGYSDITALATAIHTQTGLVTYSGPHFSSFAMRHDLAYTVSQFAICLFGREPYDVVPSPAWRDDPWWLDQDNCNPEENPGYQVIQPGEATGRIVGGNLCTLTLLQGTAYMPSLQDTLLFVEDDAWVGADFAVAFDRNLQSLLHQPDADGIRGVVIGRCQRGSQVTFEQLTAIIGSKPELAGKPVIYGADFGHTTPQFTFPIGGTGRLEATPEAASLTIVTH